MKHKITPIGGKRVNSAIKGGYWMLLRDEAEDGSVMWYRASAIPSAFDTRGPETLVFPCDENGKTTKWTEIVGVPEMDFDKAIAELKAVLEGRAEYDIFDSPAYQSAGDPITYVLNTLKGVLNTLKTANKKPPED